MKRIKYQIMREINRGTEDTPDIERVFRDKEIVCVADTLEANLAIAKREAYNGEYTVDDVEEISAPTNQDRLEAQVTYTAMMTDTLLEV